jgi:hypothetical protein
MEFIVEVDIVPLRHSGSRRWQRTTTLQSFAIASEVGRAVADKYRAIRIRASETGDVIAGWIGGRRVDGDHMRSLAQQGSSVRALVVRPLCLCGQRTIAGSRWCGPCAKKAAAEHDAAEESRLEALRKKATPESPKPTYVLRDGHGQVVVCQVVWNGS